MSSSVLQYSVAMPPPDLGLTNSKTCLESAKVKSMPNSAYYIADFISQAEEETILNKIATAPKPRWKVLSHRRLQTWPADLTKDILIDSPLPDWLTAPVIPRILALSKDGRNQNNGIFNGSPHHAPNHVLVNEYLPGQGIMPHKDGSAYYPAVCTVSLGASLCLDIYGTSDNGTRETNPRWRIFQEPRSLLIISDDLYTEYLHGIAEVGKDMDLRQETVANWSLLQSPDLILNGTSERKTRTSLTYRDVVKVSKIGNKIGMFGGR